MNKMWYNELGFHSNPFSIKPAAFHNELFGNKATINKIIKKLKKPGMVCIFGEFGSGKTTVLKKIIREFRSDDFKSKKIIYYNCNQSEESIDYDKLLVNAGGFFGRIFGTRKRGMMLLLDEMQDMNARDLERLKEYYDDGFFRSVVFVAKSSEIEVPEDLAEEIGENMFVLGNMSNKDAVLMIRKRIGDLKFFGDDMIVKIFKKDGNSRSFLKNCEDVARVAFESGADTVGVEHIEKVLG